MAKEKISFMKKVNNNKKLYFLLAFLVVLPIIFLVTMYTVRYTQFNDVCFEKNVEEHEHDEKLNIVSLDDLPIVLNYVSQYRYEPTKKNDDGAYIKKGVYGMNISYEKKEGINVTKVTARCMVYSNWTDYKFLSSTSTIYDSAPTGNTGNVKIQADYILNKMVFFPIYKSHPTLYIELIITLGSKEPNDPVYIKDTKILKNALFVEVEE